MKSFVITIKDNPQSMQVAERCIESGKKFGIEISKFYATTPSDDPRKILENNDIPTSPFYEKYSRPENCMAAFCSHHRIWQYSAYQGEEVQIFEHDAVIVSEIPQFIDYAGCISFGKPSYGKFKTPASLGVNRLTSKGYFPGAHAYRMKPNFAKHALSMAREKAKPTDLFFNLDTFPDLQEYYPWPVEVRETFTTIQKTEGCLAKHAYNDKYQII